MNLVERLRKIAADECIVDDEDVRAVQRAADMIDPTVSYEEFAARWHPPAHEVRAKAPTDAS